MRSNFSRLSKPEVDNIIGRANLTDDELKIFKMLCRGKSLDEICFEMAISKATVSRRIKEIKTKAGGKDMVKAVPVWEKVTMTVEEAADYSNIGVNKISSMLNEPGCTFILNVGKGKRLVKRKEFERFIEKSREI